MRTRPRIRRVQALSIRIACGVAELLAGSCDREHACFRYADNKGGGASTFQSAMCKCFSYFRQDYFFFIFKCDAKLLGNQLVGSCEKASVNENSGEQKFHFSVPADFISFLEEKKNRLKKKQKQQSVQRSERQ